MVAKTRSKTNKERILNESLKMVEFIFSKRDYFRNKLNNIRSKLDSKEKPVITADTKLSRSDYKLLNLLKEIRPWAFKCWDIMLAHDEITGIDMTQKACMINEIAIFTRTMLDTPDNWGEPEWDDGLWLTPVEEERIKLRM
jgi:hypothetical protein